VSAAFGRLGVEARRYFWPPLHTLTRYAGRQCLPVTEALAEELLCLPLYSRMDEATLLRVEGAIRCVAEEFGP